MRAPTWASVRRAAWAAAIGAAVVAGSAASAAQNTVDLGAPVWNFVAPNAVLLPGSHSASWVATAAGYPAILAEVNPETGAEEDAVRLPDAHGAYAYAVSPSGTVYVGTYPFGAVYAYPPGSSVVKQIATVGSGRLTIWSMAYDTENSTLYVGTDQQAHMFAVSLPGGQVTDVGDMLAGHRSVRSMTYANGIVYAGIGSKAGIIAYNPATGSTQNLLPARFANQSAVDSLQVVGGLLFAHLTDYQELVFNLSTGGLVSVLGQVKSNGVSPETADGQTAFVQGSRSGAQIEEYNLTTHRLTSVSSELTPEASTYLGSVGTNAVALASLPGAGYPGQSVIGMGSKGTFWAFNLAKGFLVTGPVTVNASTGSIESLAAGPDGSVYGSSYLSGSTFVYPGAGTTLQDQNLSGPGQAEDLLWANGLMYFGVYPGAEIFAYNPAQPWNWGPYRQGQENPSHIATIGDGQDRPMALAVGPDGTLYVGTVPVANELGGALAVLAPGAARPKVMRNLVPGQSIDSLVVADGLVVGATTVAGGLGATPTAKAAELFTYSPQTGSVTATQTPFASAGMISGLAAGPNGMVYGLTPNAVFAYDPRSNTVVDENPFDPTAAATANWGNTLSLVVGPDGNLYGSDDGNLIEVNPQTLAVTVLVKGGVERVVEATTGIIYFSGDSGTHLEALLTALSG